MTIQWVLVLAINLRVRVIGRKQFPCLRRPFE